MLAAAPRARVNTYRRHETPDIASDVLSSGLFGPPTDPNLSGVRRKRQHYQPPQRSRLDEDAVSLPPLPTADLGTPPSPEEFGARPPPSDSSVEVSRRGSCTSAEPVPVQGATDALMQDQWGPERTRGPALPAQRGAVGAQRAASCAAATAAAEAAGSPRARARDDPAAAAAGGGGGPSPLDLLQTLNPSLLPPLHGSGSPAVLKGIDGAAAFDADSPPAAQRWLRQVASESELRLPPRSRVKRLSAAELLAPVHAALDEMRRDPAAADEGARAAREAVIYSDALGGALFGRVGRLDGQLALALRAVFNAHAALTSALPERAKRQADRAARAESRLGRAGKQIRAAEEEGARWRAAAEAAEGKAALAAAQQARGAFALTEAKREVGRLEAQQRADMERLTAAIAAGRDAAAALKRRQREDGEGFQQLIAVREAHEAALLELTAEQAKAATQGQAIVELQRALDESSAGDQGRIATLTQELRVARRISDDAQKDLKKEREHGEGLAARLAKAEGEVRRLLDDGGSRAQRLMELEVEAKLLQSKLERATADAVAANSGRNEYGAEAQRLRDEVLELRQKGAKAKEAISSLEAQLMRVRGGSDATWIAREAVLLAEVALADADAVEAAALRLELRNTQGLLAAARSLAASSQQAAAEAAAQLAEAAADRMAAVAAAAAEADDERAVAVAEVQQQLTEARDATEAAEARAAAAEAAVAAAAAAHAAGDEAARMARTEAELERVTDEARRAAERADDAEIALQQLRLQHAGTFAKLDASEAMLAQERRQRVQLLAQLSSAAPASAGAADAARTRFDAAVLVGALVEAEIEAAERGARAAAAAKELGGRTPKAKGGRRKARDGGFDGLESHGGSTPSSVGQSGAPSCSSTPAVPLRQLKGSKGMRSDGPSPPPVGDGASPPTKLATIASERALLTPGSMGRTPSMAPAATPGSVGRTPSTHRRKSAKSTGDLGGDDSGGAANFARRSRKSKGNIGERVGI